MNNNERKLLGPNLRLIRHRMGLTQEKFGALVGKSRAVYQTYESNGHEPSNEVLRKLAKVCRMSETRLLNQDLRTLSDDQWAEIDSEYDAKQWMTRLAEVRP